MRILFNPEAEAHGFVDLGTSSVAVNEIYVNENGLLEQLYTDFVTYRLDEPVAINGTFYVGFYQNHSVQLNLGFDQNTDSREHFLYKTTNEWREPFLKGTPMVRPVIGAPIPVPEDIVERDCAEAVVYPNPAATQITIVLPDGACMAVQNLFMTPSL